MIILDRVFPFFLLLASAKSLKTKSKLSFSIVGDWGGSDGDPTTKRGITMAQSMNRMAPKFETEFVLLLGDNFYQNGILKSAEEAASENGRFTTTFDKIFDPKFENIGNLSYFVQTGNHDYRGNVSAQIEFTEIDPLGRWKMPDLYYNLGDYYDTNFGNNSTTTVEIITIDTDIFLGHFGMDQKSGLAYERFLQQKEWLENQLESEKSKKADYLIIAGHHPIFSISSHGNTEFLVEHLYPIFKKYKVSLYLAGHDHNLQSIVDNYSDDSDDFSMHHIVTGAGSKVKCSTENLDNLPNSAKSNFFWCGDENFGGWTQIEIFEEKLLLSHFTAENDRLLDVVEILPRSVGKSSSSRSFGIISFSFVIFLSRAFQ